MRNSARQSRAALNARLADRSSLVAGSPASHTSARQRPRLIQQELQRRLHEALARSSTTAPRCDPDRHFEQPATRLSLPLGSDRGLRVDALLRVVRRLRDLLAPPNRKTSSA